MRSNAMLGMLLAAVAQGVALKPSQQQDMNSMIRALPTADGKIHRSKVKPNRPGKKTNRYNTSARVRRAHRRAA